jgi:hypothetical protein
MNQGSIVALSFASTCLLGAVIAEVYWRRKVRDLRLVHGARIIEFTWYPDHDGSYPLIEYEGERYQCIISASPKDGDIGSEHSALINET